MDNLEETVNTACPTPLPPTKVSTGVVDLINHSNLTNLANPLGNWVYGNITQDQYYI